MAPASLQPCLWSQSTTPNTTPGKQTSQNVQQPSGEKLRFKNGWSRKVRYFIPVPPSRPFSIFIPLDKKSIGIELKVYSNRKNFLIRVYTRCIELSKYRSFFAIEVRNSTVQLIYTIPDYRPQGFFLLSIFKQTRERIATELVRHHSGTR